MLSILFKFTLVFLLDVQWMFFSSVKEVKECQIFIWEKLTFSKLRFCKFDHWIFELLVAAEKSEVWEQKYVWHFYYFSFDRNYDALKLKSPCFLLNKNINFNKNETEPKMINPTQGFSREEPCASAHKRIVN